MPMPLTLFEVIVAIASIIVASTSVFISYSFYRLRKKMSLLEHDNNIVSYISTILSLIDKYPNMSEEQKDIIRTMLQDAKFFQYTDDRVTEEIAFSDWSVDSKLVKFFSNKKDEKNI